MVRPFGAITSTNYGIPAISSSDRNKRQTITPIQLTDLVSAKTADEAVTILSKWLDGVKYGALHPEYVQKNAILSPLEAIEFLQSDQILFQPEPQIYSLMIQGALWKRWEKEYSPKKCAKLLDRFLKALMKEAAIIDDKKSLLKLVHTVMTSSVQAKNISRAEEWLKALEEPQSLIRPTSLTYSIVINAWSRIQVPQRAEATLYRMIFRKQTDNALIITKNYFHRCLDAWVHSKDKMAGERAEVLLLKMQDENNERRLEGGGPCIQSWFKVVCAWTNSNKSQRDAAPRAQRILELILQNEEFDWSHRENAKWVVETYLQVMRAWSFHGGNLGFERVGALVEALFNRVKAEEDVTNLTENVANRIFLHLVTSLVKSDFDDLADRLKILFLEIADRNLNVDWNTANFNLVLNVYAKARDGPEAENILKKMLQLALDGKDDCLPNTQSFNSVILAWSKSDDRTSACTRAEEIFILMKRVEGVTPNVATYNALLSAMGGSGDLETATRGDRYFKELKRAYADTKNPSFRPNNITYTKVISLWSNITSPEALERSDALLQEMLAPGTTDDDLRPTIATYKAFQSVLASSDAQDKHKRIEEVQEAMKKLR
jgi:hypothetical protein